VTSHALPHSTAPSAAGRIGRYVLATLVLAVLAGAPDASAATFGKGRYSLGLTGGGGQSSASIGASFGYMVLDGLQPSLAVGYNWSGHDLGDSHKLETTLELRYYIYEFQFLAPFVFVNTSHIYLAFRGTPEEDHNFFRAGGGVGVAILVSRAIAFSINVSIGGWLGANQSLYDRGILADPPLFSYGFGLNFFL
jgi:hypothetical protein